MKKIIKTDMLNRYMLKLIFRVSIFIAVLIMYIADKDMMLEFLQYEFTFSITLLHLVWIVFMVTMILHLFPHDKLSMALRKGESQNYVPVRNYSEHELLKYVQDQNIKAWKVMLIWLSFNAVFGLLYLVNVIDSADLLMLTVFYYLCDYICILFFCPFQNFVMKNKCCVNCRIYDWGHFMMFTPMLFIKNFYSWSLFFTSLVVLIHWEINYAKNPERFWNGSNQTLQCRNCKDKTCQMKKR
ncbi:MAG: hypothetical protein IKL73_02795 [Lachnospiraceae bacterium]|nr:hypothetical protein [Lachnospiraceae bacterium]